MATKRKPRNRAPKVEVEGVKAVTICRYRIKVGDREWTGDTVEGFGRDLNEAAETHPTMKRIVPRRQP